MRLDLLLGLLLAAGASATTAGAQSLEPLSVDLATYCAQQRASAIERLRSECPAENQARNIPCGSDCVFGSAPVEYEAERCPREPFPNDRAGDRRPCGFTVIVIGGPREAERTAYLCRPPEWMVDFCGSPLGGAEL